MSKLPYKQAVEPLSVPGIPGTFLDPASASIRWVRNQMLECAVNASPSGSISPNRVYLAEVADGWLRAFTSSDPPECGGGKRLSVCHYRISENSKCEYFRLPTWDELKSARYTLIIPTAHMAMIMPASARCELYVDSMPWVLQLCEIPAEVVE